MNTVTDNHKFYQFALIIILLNISCTSKETKTITNEIGGVNFSVINIPENVRERLELVKAEHNKEHVVIAEQTDNPDLSAVLQKLDPNQIRSMYVERDSSSRTVRSFIILVIDTLSDSAANSEELYFSVEQPASPAPDLKTYLTWLYKTIQYPTTSKSEALSGKVLVEFDVEKDGNITNIKVRRGLGNDYDEEAIRVMRLSPPWNAGLQRGKPVVQKMILPISFGPDKAQMPETENNRPEMSKEKLTVTNNVHQTAEDDTLIEGQVTFNGTPVPDVNIVLAGTTEGTFTNAQGLFTFRTKTKRGKLVFSHISFVTGELIFGQ
jgi:TonB family protein